MTITDLPLCALLAFFYWGTTGCVLGYAFLPPDRWADESVAIATWPLWFLERMLRTKKPLENPRLR